MGEAFITRRGQYVTPPPQIQSGLITMFFGLATGIPEGFLLCDGTNGTPDLRNRFVVGAGSTYSVEQTGGNKNAVNISHTHTGTLSSNGEHTHNFTVRNWQGDLTTKFRARGGSSTQPTSTSTSSAGGAHSHSFNIPSAGESGVDKNLPPYYSLLFIIKE